MMVSAGSAMGGDDFLGRHGAVERGNAFLQIRGAFNGTIGEPAGAEIIKECVLIGSGQFKSSSMEIESTQVSAMLYLAPVS